MNMNREQVVEKLKNRLDSWNEDLAAMETRAASLKDEGREEFDKAMADLKRKRDVAEAELGRLSTASDAAFDDVLSGIQKGWDEVSASFERARQRYH